MTAFSAKTAEASVAPELALVGTWHLVSYALRDGASDVIYPLGKEAQGQIIYDVLGNMSCHLINPSPPERPRDVQDGTAYEACISYERYSSYYGPYEVDVVSRQVHHHVVGALMPGWVGTTVVRSYAFDGPDTVTLSAKTGFGEQQAILKWHRAR